MFVKIELRPELGEDLPKEVADLLINDPVVNLQVGAILIPDLKVISVSTNFNTYDSFQVGSKRHTVGSFSSQIELLQLKAE